MKSKALMAETHPSEYLIHKYWARKPSNILKEYISEYFSDADLLVDPFCGSGVFLAEAKKQNISAQGFDLNPTAQLLSEVTTNPPLVEEYLAAANEIIELAETFKELYKVNNKDVRYYVHQMEASCPGCNNIYSTEGAQKKGSGYYCTNCDSRIYFNFEKSVGTRITKIYDIENNVYEGVDYEKEQKSLSKKIPKNAKGIKLITNRRILSFPGMELSDLFTPRAYYVLSQLFEKANSIKDERVKNAILVLLTSGVAQCSRLIPYRNNLKTGGPAWTIPGFWIAPLHMETNPIIHIKARNKKMLKGLEALNESYKNTNSQSKVFQMSAQSGLKKVKDGTVDGFFFDPPYGDNVPYVEFSAIWNGFLNKDIPYDDEIIVSDRKEFVSSWDKYQKDISEIIRLFSKKLSKKGKVLMTFNNLDPRAWKIVLDAFANESLVCTDAKYQIPAVVSSKSQTASNTSYVGDYYCIFEKGVKSPLSDKKIFELTQTAKKIIVSRDGKAAKNLVHRAIILKILNEQFDTALLSKFDEILKPISTQDKDHYILRDELKDECKTTLSLQEVVISAAENALFDGKVPIKIFYERILEDTADIGSPQLGESKKILEGYVFFDKNFAYLQKTTDKLF